MIKPQASASSKYYSQRAKGQVLLITQTGLEVHTLPAELSSDSMSSGRKQNETKINFGVAEPHRNTPYDFLRLNSQLEVKILKTKL
jgi:hypothetical protein